ncbi:YceD family protein [Telmatospirillum siberiense]|uniref:DUF177 domain-containing protein n=1 Tax=Telmatospirillum siberiense TaxID=382514 RepID=A0A2N3PYS1_9PROT|nr:DUF177 domain-containing protein [Telmatospirillum siberiense]PKU25564.1 hypothetical protein CWS72_05740 [Telmatospirillum siberiense]
MIAIEFSRPVQVDRFGHDERRYDIEANGEERAALAERYGILSVDSFTAHLRLRRISGERLLLKGRFSADVVQSCVVSLEPVSAHLEEDFSLVYAADLDEEDVEVDIGLTEEDPPEPIEGGVIDLGEAAAEHLALALDPFPRAPGASFQGGDEPPEPEPPPKVSPFAALASLKKK